MSFYCLISSSYLRFAIVLRMTNSQMTESNYYKVRRALRCTEDALLRSYIGQNSPVNRNNGYFENANNELIANRKL